MCGCYFRLYSKGEGGETNVPSLCLPIHAMVYQLSAFTSVYNVVYHCTGTFDDKDVTTYFMIFGFFNSNQNFSSSNANVSTTVL